MLFHNQVLSFITPLSTRGLHTQTPTHIQALTREHMKYSPYKNCSDVGCGIILIGTAIMTGKINTASRKSILPMTTSCSGHNTHLITLI